MNLWNRMVNGLVDKNLRFKKNATITIENSSGAGVTTLSASELRALDGITATAAEINMAADNSTNAVIITGTKEVSAAESGTTFFINNATGFVSTLPAPFIGAKYTFINMTANTSGNHTVVTTSSANIIKGNQNSVAGDAGDTGTGDDTISFVANQSLAGDKVELFSDGTSWFAYAISRVAAGMTFTTAS